MERRGGLPHGEETRLTGFVVYQKEDGVIQVERGSSRLLNHLTKFDKAQWRGENRSHWENGSVRGRWKEVILLTRRGKASPSRDYNHLLSHS